MPLVMKTLIFQIVLMVAFFVGLSASSPIWQQRNLLDGLHLPSVGNIVASMDVPPTVSSGTENQFVPEAPHHVGIVEGLPVMLDHELDSLVGPKCESGLHSDLPIPVDTPLPINNLSENKLST